jgi:hypothetical protein
MAPRKQAASQILRDGVALDEAGQEALTEQRHHRLGIP